jgi:hypothetical protein
MIVLRSPKGLDRAEGRRRPADRGHVPLAPGADPRRRQASRPREAAGKLDEELQGGGTVSTRTGRSKPNWPNWRRRARGAWAPTRTPTAECCCATSECRIFAITRFNVPSPGAVEAQDTMVLGKFLRDVHALNEDKRNFRIFGPDETLSNLLGDVFEVTNRQWDARKVEERRVPRSRRAASSTRCSASINARAGWRAIC